MHRDTVRRWSILGYWIEGVLLVPWLAYWLIADPKHLPNTAWFWGMATALAIGAVALLVLAIVLRFVTRGDPDHLDTLNQRATIDTSVRAKWK